MKNQKQLFLNEVLTGLLVAAAFAAVVPVDVFAQTLEAVGTAAQQSILKPFVEFASYAAYGVGTVMVVAGIAGCKKHADSPGNNPLAPALGRLGAGAGLLAAPSVAGMLSSTAGTTGTTGITGASSYTGIGGF